MTTVDREANVDCKSKPLTILISEC